MSKKENLKQDTSQTKLFETPKRKREETIESYPIPFKNFLSRLLGEDYNEDHIQRLCQDITFFSDKFHFPPKSILKHLTNYLLRSESKNKQLVYATLMELNLRFPPEDYPEMYFIPNAKDFLKILDSDSLLVFEEDGIYDDIHKEKFFKNEYPYHEFLLNEIFKYAKNLKLISFFFKSYFSSKLSEQTKKSDPSDAFFKLFAYKVKKNDWDVYLYWIWVATKSVVAHSHFKSDEKLKEKILQHLLELKKETEEKNIDIEDYLEKSIQLCQ